VPHTEKAQVRSEHRHALIAGALGLSQDQPISVLKQHLETAGIPPAADGKLELEEVRSAQQLRALIMREGMPLVRDEPEPVLVVRERVVVKMPAWGLAALLSVLLLPWVDDVADQLLSLNLLPWF
jgi:hypothetical protein